jgi:hypothetical protein
MAAVISLDQIVKNILLKRRYSFHWYIELLVYAKDGLRTIAQDIEIVAPRYKLLPVTDYRIDWPTDYMDYTAVSVRVDQYIHPLVEDDALQLVPNYDENFDIQPYNQGIATSPNYGQFGGYYAGYGYPFSYWALNNWNSWGENTGRQFGGITSYNDTFKVDKRARQIKINENLCVTEVLLEYISNGMDSDSATHIDSYAKDAIEAYCYWQFKENNRTYSAGEAEAARQLFLNQLPILRARISDLTITKMKRLIQKNQRGIQY